MSQPDPKSTADLLREAHEAINDMASYHDPKDTTELERRTHKRLDAAVEAAGRKGEALSVAARMRHFRRGAREALVKVSRYVDPAASDIYVPSLLDELERLDAEYADPPADERCPDGDACPDAKFHAAADEKGRRRE